MLNKTKAALQSRSCQLTTSNSRFQDITVIGLVNPSGYAAMQYTPRTAASLAQLSFNRLNFEPAVFINIFFSVPCWLNFEPTDFIQLFGSKSRQLNFESADFYQLFVSSRADFLCRLLISVLAAAIKKPAMLSSDSFTFSINSKSSRGSLTDTCSDLLFLLPVAITESPCSWWCSVCLRKFSNQTLTWCSPVNILVVFTSFELVTRNDEARQCANTNRASYHNVIEAYIMAEHQHTQTHPEFTYNTKFFTWRFMALSATDSHVIHITATTEREAREQSPQGCVMVFAGRLPAEVRHA